MAARVEVARKDKSKDDKRVAGKRARSMDVEVPGSSLTYSEVDSISQLENEEYHFVGIDINSFKDHVSKKSIASTVQDNLTK